jgi:diaminohydroxyphosphoribosylaminopyrimidine deaminase/5-amino-6-(5-phosphoribosylamino)uracil reductase
MDAYSPVRVVLDAKLRLPLDTHLVQTVRQTPLWVVGGIDAPRPAEEALRAKGAEVFRVPETDGRLDLSAVLKRLAERGVTRLMFEGGPTLGAAFIAADLVDEAILFHSGKVIGSDGIDAFEGGPAALTQRLKQAKVEPVGADRQECYERR